MLRVIIALVIMAHGVGHVLFLVPLLGIADWGQSTGSWLIRTATQARLFGSVIWIGAIVLFLAAGIDLLGLQPAWRPAAIAASVLSLVGITLFWDSPTSAPSVFAATVDITLLVLVILAVSPTSRALGI